MPTRIKLAVYTNLDPVPGTFHSAESAQNVVRGLLKQRLPESYHPMVSIESSDVRKPQPAERTDMDTLMHEFEARLQAMYDNRTAGDYSFLGILSDFMERVSDNPDILKRLIERHNRWHAEQI